VAATRTTPAVEVLECGCAVEIKSGSRRVAEKCVEAQLLFLTTKRAGERSNDPKIKGGAKVALCREFDRRRAMFREHIGLGA
jgi:hypothetical protein